jgi:hypothetical protein
VRVAFDCERTDYKALMLALRLLKHSKAVVFLNGTPVLWSHATQGPRMRMDALVTIDLAPPAVRLLRKGRNVLAARVSSSNGADFGLYATAAGDPLAFKPRPKGWAPGPKIDAPDLSARTARPPRIATVLPPNTTALAIDVPGKPNEALSGLRVDFIGIKDNAPLGKTPLARRAKYLGHFDPRIRRDAAYSLMAEGAKAMPYILKALESKDVRVIRAGCDALAGNYRMNGRGMPHLREAMTPDVAGQAAGKLLPLLEHEDTYVREGALMALANCGKAAAGHLDKITRLSNDKDWWVRAGVAYVLQYVQEPETQDHAAPTLRNFRTEESIFGKNRLRDSLIDMARRGHSAEKIVNALIADARGDDGFSAGMAIGALGRIGPNAKAAAPLFEERLAQARKRAAEATTDRARQSAERQIRNLEGILRKMTTTPTPPRTRKPKRDRKKK